MLEKKLLEELNRYNEINRYTYLLEQAASPSLDDDTNNQTPGATAPGATSDPTAGGSTDATAGAPGSEPTGDDPTGGAGAALTDPTGASGAPLPSTDGPESGSSPDADVDSDAPTDPSSDDTTETIDITDLVNMTKNIKQQLDKSSDENGGVVNKMNDVFTKLSELESKLGEMDKVIAKIDQLGQKVDEMRPQTPQEKLEMRSLDSYPYNQRPQDFFNEKLQQMKASGKNDYVLTKNDVDSYAKDQIMKSFSPQNDTDNQ